MHTSLIWFGHLFIVYILNPIEFSGIYFLVSMSRVTALLLLFGNVKTIKEVF